MYEDEQQAKAQAHLRWQQEQTAATCGQGGSINTGTASGMLASALADYKPTLRDRLKRQIESAGREQKRSRCANELFDLLNKNPEVARIFELMEEIN